MRDKIGLLKELMAKHGKVVQVSFTTSSNNSSHFMLEFFTKVGQIRANLKQIESYYSEIIRLHNSILSSADQNSEHNTQLEVLMELVKKDTSNIRFALKEIEKEIQNHSTENKPNNPTVQFRIMQTQYASMLFALHEVITKYNSSQVEYRARCKERIKRQLSLADQPIDDNELENMIEQDQVAIFTRDIVTETMQAKQSLADVEARHQDILKLEKSIRDLHEIFLDLSILIESQGDLVNRIDLNVRKAQDSIETANVELRKAVQLKSKVNKKQFIIIGVVVGAIVIIAVLIAVSVKYG